MRDAANKASNDARDDDIIGSADRGIAFREVARPQLAMLENASQSAASNEPKID